MKHDVLVTFLWESTLTPRMRSRLEDVYLGPSWSPLVGDAEADWIYFLIIIKYSEML